MERCEVQGRSMDLNYMLRARDETHISATQTSADYAQFL